MAIVLLVPAFLVIHNWQSAPASNPVAAVPEIENRTNPARIAPPAEVAQRPAKKIHALVPAEQAAPASTAAVVTDDPTELWKSVRSGSARAEVTLAKLYLDGNTVPQSCEQTHMLLLAASKKGYKAADNLLSGAYAERCQKDLTQ